jgi:hypothetical protein
MGKQFETLEYHADLRSQRWQIGGAAANFLSVDKDLSLLERFKAIDGLDQCGFSGTGRAAHDYNLPFIYLRRATAQYLEIAVPLANVPDFYHIILKTLI